MQPADYGGSFFETGVFVYPVMGNFPAWGPEVYHSSRTPSSSPFGINQNRNTIYGIISATLGDSTRSSGAPTTDKFDLINTRCYRHTP